MEEWRGGSEVFRRNRGSKVEEEASLESASFLSVPSLLPLSFWSFSHSFSPLASHLFCLSFLYYLLPWAPFYFLILILNLSLFLPNLSFSCPRFHFFYICVSSTRFFFVSTFTFLACLFLPSFDISFPVLPCRRNSSAFPTFLFSSFPFISFLFFPLPDLFFSFLLLHFHPFPFHFLSSSFIDLALFSSSLFMYFAPVCFLILFNFCPPLTFYFPLPVLSFLFSPILPF